MATKTRADLIKELRYLLDRDSDALEYHLAHAVEWFPPKHLPSHTAPDQTFERTFLIFILRFVSKLSDYHLTDLPNMDFDKAAIQDGRLVPDGQEEIMGIRFGELVDRLKEVTNRLISVGTTYHLNSMDMVTEDGHVAHFTRCTNATIEKAIEKEKEVHAEEDTKLGHKLAMHRIKRICRKKGTREVAKFLEKRMK